MCENNVNKSNQTLEADDDYSNQDDIVNIIGAFGVWQAKVCTRAALTRCIAMWNMISIVFLTQNTEFTCTKFENNLTKTAERSTCYNDCDEYTFVGQTLISDFQLICENAWLASFTQTILMFGLLIGVSIFGWISDRFGRRRALLLSTLMNVTFMFATSFSGNYWTFNSFRFLTGVASGGNLHIGVVYILEIIGTKYREAGGCCALLLDGVAEASLAGFAYFTSSWNKYILGYTIASLIIFLIIITLPESPLWLISHQQIDEAIKVMTDAAKCNKLDVENINDAIADTIEKMKASKRVIGPNTYINLFQTKKLAIKTISSFLIWSITGVCYFGINQYVTFFDGNIYLAVVFLGLIQIPVNPLSMVLNKVFGRKKTIICSLIFTSLITLPLIFIQSTIWINTTCGIIGLGSISTTFAVLYVHASELFPTSLRNMGYGFISAGSKIGAMIAPFIAALNPQWIPSLIFACLPVLAAMFCLLLPETKGQKLQDV